MNIRNFAHAATIGGLVLTLTGISAQSQAFPEFARKYHVTCARCHVGFPKLNSFGKNFQLHGYQQPGDKEVGKEKIPEDKNLSLLQNLPVGAFIENNLQLDKKVKSDNPIGLNSPDAFHLLLGGTIAPDIGMFAELESSDEGTGMAKTEVTFNHLGNQNIHLQLGKLDPMEHGVTQHDLFTLSNYAIYQLGDFGLGNFNLGDENRGIRVYGLVNAAVTPALIHGGPPGTTPDTTTPDTTTPPPPNHGPAVLQDKKDKGDQGDQEEAEPMDPMDQLKGGLWEVGVFTGSGDPIGKDAKDAMARFNMYFNNDSFVGVYGYTGRSVIGDPVTGVDNNHRLVGADFSTYWGKPFEKSPGVMQKPINILGGYVNGKDDNPLGDGTKVSWHGGFVEADYIMRRSAVVLRYDRVTSPDFPDMRRNLVTANYTFWLRTNFELGVEYTHDNSNTRLNGLGLIFNFAF